MIREAPLLSVCIPTYNRSRSLDSLLRQLAEVVKDIGPDIEVCVSDNNSTDDTQEVIEKWSRRIPIVERKNCTNLGFSGNVNALLDMARGNWMCIVGDDDLVIEKNVRPVLEILRHIDPDQWILLPVVNPASRRGCWLKDLRAGSYSRSSMLATVWKMGIHDFGFIGSHVFNLKHKAAYQQIPLEYSDHWIHLNYWLVHLLARGNFYVSSMPLVQINTSVSQNPYLPPKWAVLWSQRLINFTNVGAFLHRGRVILTITMVREVFAWSQAKEWVKFFLRHPRTSSARLTVLERRLRPSHTRPWLLRATFRALRHIYYLGGRMTFRLK
jgi:glycosyltransferase involved in cell wall biosynthesis